MQKINDPALTKCDQCSGKLERLISASGLMFKGSGWYVTDYSQKLKDPKASKSPGDEKSKPAPTSGEGSKKASTETPKKKDSPAKKD